MSDQPSGPLTNLSGRVTLWLARGGSVGLAAMMFLTLFDVVGRAFGHPIVGTVEVTELIMGMMVYLGVGYTTFMRGHIRVDILITVLKPRVQAVLDLITLAIGFVFVALICWRLILQAESRLTNGDLTSIWELQVWPVAFVMAFASIFMMTSMALHLALTAKAVVTGQPYSMTPPEANSAE